MSLNISRPLYTLFTLPLFALLLASCAGDELDAPRPSDPSAGEDGYITVNIHSREISTRATEPGKEEWNENLIQSVTLSLWPNAGDFSEETAPVVMQTFSGLADADGDVAIRIPLTGDLLNVLFNQDSDRECLAFAAVNVDPADAKTVADLRKLAISSSFDTQKIQPNFAMDGTGTVKLSGTKAVGKIDVKRSASKITLALNIEEKVTETVGGQTLIWHPDLKGMAVRLISGVKDSQLDPAPKEGMADDNYFSTHDDLVYSFSKTDAKDYPWLQQHPFYTYPNKWKSSRDEMHRTFMILSVPWTSDGHTYRTCYYQVPVVPVNRNETVRNMSYHINLHVGMLGSFVPDEPTEITADYYVADWGEENIDVDIKDFRFLVVDYNEYVVNNENRVEIPFYTSHPTKVVKAEMRFWRFNFSDEGTPFVVTVSDAQNIRSNSKGGGYVYKATFDNKISKLIVEHPLKVFEPYRSNGNAVSLTNNDGPNTTRPKTQTQSAINTVLNRINYYRQTDVDEYSKVEFTVTVQHEDMVGTDKFTETVTITQYPGIYITAIQNAYTRTGGDLSGTGAQASVWINGNNTEISGLSYGVSNGGKTNGWTTSIGLSTGYLNWNPNLYQITITQLPSGTKYVIGDPRAYDINNNLTNGSMGKRTPTVFSQFINAPDVDGKTRKLRNYYPTNESEDAMFIIAPKFRICSSYAGTGNILNRTYARRRCAAYQEMGYPAGRWRLPTYGEVDFIMQLAADYKIPRLFGRSDAASWWYWCAQGAAKVPGKKDTARPSLDKSIPDSQPERTRFVYDEWYWGEEMIDKVSNRYPFTWGDREKSNPEDRAIRRPARR